MKDEEKIRAENANHQLAVCGEVRLARPTISNHETLAIIARKTK